MNIRLSQTVARKLKVSADRLGSTPSRVTSDLLKNLAAMPEDVLRSIVMESPDAAERALRSISKSAAQKEVAAERPRRKMVG